MFDPHSSPLTIHHRPRNRNTYITITHEGEVCVRTPLNDEKRIRSLVLERREWINAKLQMILASAAHHHVWGKSIRFRGEVMELEKLPSLHEKVKKGNNENDIKKYYYHFYKKEALLTLPSRIMHYSRKMGLIPSEIRYKKMKRRWGSCSSEGIVTFNTQMMQLSYEHMDYIIVHELAHLKHMNHSKEFHSLVRQFLSNERELRQALKHAKIL